MLAEERFDWSTEIDPCLAEQAEAEAYYEEDEEGCDHAAFNPTVSFDIASRDAGRYAEKLAEERVIRQLLRLPKRK